MERTLVDILDAMLEAGWVKSKGEARRLIKQGAVEFSDGEIIQAPGKVFLCLDNGGVIVRCGKRHIARFIERRSDEEEAPTQEGRTCGAAEGS